MFRHYKIYSCLQESPNLFEKPNANTINHNDKIYNHGRFEFAYRDYLNNEFTTVVTITSVKNDSCCNFNNYKSNGLLVDEHNHSIKAPPKLSNLH